MGEYKNMGPPWRRAGGDIVPHGGTFTATEREEERIRRLGSRLRRFAPVKTVSVPSPSKQKSKPDRTLPEWPMRLTPEEYLRRYPTGQHAVLARQLQQAAQTA